MLLLQSKCGRGVVTTRPHFSRTVTILVTCPRLELPIKIPSLLHNNKNRYDKLWYEKSMIKKWEKQLNMLFENNSWTKCGEPIKYPPVHWTWSKFSFKMLKVKGKQTALLFWWTDGQHSTAELPWKLRKTKFTWFFWNERKLRPSWSWCRQRTLNCRRLMLVLPWLSSFLTCPEQVNWFPLTVRGHKVLIFSFFQCRKKFHKERWKHVS